MNRPAKTDRPLSSLDDWEEDLRRRYPQPLSSAADGTAETPSGDGDAAGRPKAFRNYKTDTRPGVREFYRLNHRYQTFAFVEQKRREYLPPRKRQMGIWEAMELLNTLVDDSDPDTELSQIEHLMQTAEAILADGHPRWFVLTGLIHDLGKILCLFGEPQWAVVGDTFPVGCAFSDRVVLAEFFADNPDRDDPRYNTPLGVYPKGIGLGNVWMSWGHDEYLYHVVRDHLPEPALTMIRYHSFYAAHREGAYDYLMNDHDRELLAWVRKFNPYDLYSKSDAPPDVDKLRPYYQDLIAEFFPDQLWW